jgi:hypothetical protein
MDFFPFLPSCAPALTRARASRRDVQVRNKTRSVCTVYISLGHQAQPRQRHGRAFPRLAQQFDKPA